MVPTGWSRKMVSTEKKTKQKKLQVYSSFNKAEQNDGIHQYPLPEDIPENSCPSNQYFKIKKLTSFIKSLEAFQRAAIVTMVWKPFKNGS